MIQAIVWLGAAVPDATPESKILLWALGVLVAMLTSVIGFIIKGIKGDIRDLRQSDIAMQARIEANDTKLLNKLEEIRAVMVRLETKSEHDRPSLPCQEWAKELVESTFGRIAEYAPVRPRPRPKPPSTRSKG